MMKDKKRLANILIAVTLVFIWGNSMRTGDDSHEMSQGIFDWFNFFLHLKDYGAGIVHHLIRKMAHFAEYAWLGGLIAWRFRMSEEKHVILIPVLLAMAAGLVDETVQLFAINRGPSLMDVWLDTSGAVAGVLLLTWGHHMRKKKQNPNILEENHDEKDDFYAAGCDHGSVPGCLRRQ